MAFLNPGEQDQGVLRSQGAATAGMQEAGQAYSNYRQNNRDNYANQLSNQSSLYQGYLNRMASAYGNQGSPNVAQMGNNPMSLAQTTVGSTHGSNAAGSGVDFSGGGQLPGGGIDPKAYGLIGQMDLEGQGKWDSGPGTAYGFRPGNLDANGQPRDISTGNSNPQSPGPVAPQPSGQFNFAPRKV